MVPEYQKRRNVISFCVVLCGMVWFGIVYYGMILYGMIMYGMS